MILQWCWKYRIHWPKKRGLEVVQPFRHTSLKIAEIAQGLKYFLMFLHPFQYRSGCSLDKNGQQGCPFYKFLDKTL